MIQLGGFTSVNTVLVHACFNSAHIHAQCMLKALVHVIAVFRCFIPAISITNLSFCLLDSVSADMHTGYEKALTFYIYIVLV